MTNDRTHEVRRAVVGELKILSPLNALGVDPDAIFAMQARAAPGYPFVRIGSIQTDPIRAACVDGCELRLTIDAFASDVHDRDEGSLLDTGESRAQKMAAAIAQGLHGRSLTLNSGGTVRLRWTGSRIVQDPEEANVFHAIVSFTARSLA